jgi:capsule polysaccharide export protein KpsE/RkpR
MTQSQETLAKLAELQDEHTRLSEQKLDLISVKGDENAPGVREIEARQEKIRERISGLQGLTQDEHNAQEEQIDRMTSMTERDLDTTEESEDPPGLTIGVDLGDEPDPEDEDQ